MTPLGSEELGPGEEDGAAAAAPAVDEDAGTDDGNSSTSSSTNPTTADSVFPPQGPGHVRTAERRGDDAPVAVRM